MTFFVAQIFHGAWGAWDEIIPILLAVIFTAVVIFAVWYSRRLKAEVEEPAARPDQEG